MVHKVPKGFAIQNKVIPVSFTKNSITVAISDLYDIITLDQIKRFFDNLSKCLLCVDKSTKLNDKTDDIKDKLTNMSTQGYLEDITKLRDILLQRKEELEGKSPSM